MTNLPEKTPMLLFLGGIGLLEIVVFLGLLFLWIWSLIDAARNPFMKGSTRAIWIIVIVLFPFLGTLLYVLFATRRAAT
jgi:hypothetical protein